MLRSDGLRPCPQDTRTSVVFHVPSRRARFSEKLPCIVQSERSCPVEFGRYIIRRRALEVSRVRNPDPPQPHRGHAACRPSLSMPRVPAGTRHRRDDEQARRETIRRPPAACRAASQVLKIILGQLGRFRHPNGELRAAFHTRADVKGTQGGDDSHVRRLADRTIDGTRVHRERMVMAARRKVTSNNGSAASRGWLTRAVEEVR
jgi:hypothetical protein